MQYVTDFISYTCEIVKNCFKGACTCVWTVQCCVQPGVQAVIVIEYNVTGLSTAIAPERCSRKCIVCAVWEVVLHLSYVCVCVCVRMCVYVCWLADCLGRLLQFVIKSNSLHIYIHTYTLCLSVGVSITHTHTHTQRRTGYEVKL